MGAKLTTEEFIRRSLIKHDNKYTYEYSHYTKQYEKIVITCPEHGNFTQIAKDHMCGYGCQQCGVLRNVEARLKTTSQFIEDSIKRHGGKYTYSKTIYTGVYDLVKITCKEHGDFWQRAHDHLNGGCGCPRCTKSGYKSNMVGYLYIQHIKDNIYKLGISNNPSVRIEQITSKCDYNPTFYKIYTDDDGKKISILEREILKTIPHSVLDKGEMKDGYTETFLEEHLDTVLNLITQSNIKEVL